MSENLPVFVIGSGGHAKVVVDALICMGRSPEGITDADISRKGAMVLGVPVIGDDHALKAFDPSTIELALGIGTTQAGGPREKIFLSFKKMGYRFATIIHPSAIIGGESIIDEGAQILSGAVLHPGARIGCGAIINFGARIDHDCNIGAFTHVAPGAVLSGNVTVGAGAHISTGVSIIQGVRIGDGALVAAGATVIRDVDINTRVAGVPAKIMRND